MRKVFSYLRDYQREHFDWKLYFVIALFAACCIFLNYRYDFEDGVIDSYTGHPIKWLWMFLFHGLPFLVVCFILHAFDIKREWLTSRNYWLKFIIGFGLLALDRSFYGFTDMIRNVTSYDFVFVYKCVNWSSSLILSVIPMLLLYPFLEKDTPKIWYGLAFKKFDARPYLILLGLAGIVIGIGSFLSEINEYYPRYLHSGADRILRAKPETSEWLLVGIYEFCYGTNFISVELIFRGFLIFAFTRTLGGHAVLAMVVTYGFLHFGKPLGETISSLFGGYILGIIAYKSRNVWGGVFIHLGVAWLMELFGWLQQ